MQRGSIVKVPVDLEKEYQIPLYESFGRKGEYVYHRGSGKKLYSHAAKAEFVFLARSRRGYFCTSPQGGKCLYRFDKVYPVVVHRFTQYVLEQSLRRRLHAAPVHVQQLSLFTVQG